MEMTMETVIVRGGLVVTPQGARELDVVVRGERVDELLPRGAELPAGAEIVDATGTVVLPGAIDAHTHFLQDDPARPPAA
jgi:dihydroorotase-like cyclic amidohydrolase